MKKTYAKSVEEVIKARIVNDLASHTITIRHEDGLYRHYRCSNGGSSNMYFDIVTWPGSLCFTGDMGDYLFQRTDDMIEFMRRSCMSYGYAAEKCVAYGGRLKEFCEDRFEEILAERLAESLADGGDGTFRVVRRGKAENEDVAEAIEKIRQEYSEYNSPFDATKAMHESGLWDTSELPSCEEYTFHFLWCLHALKWFCERVNSSK